MSLARVVEFPDLLRDVRHLSARAASDLADWLVYLELEGKADRTLYEYVRKLAPLLREFPDKEIAEFTAADVNLVLGLVPRQSRHMSRSIINRFFVWAEEQERIDRTPMRKVPRIKHPKRPKRDIFSDEEVAMLEALPSPQGDPLQAHVDGARTEIAASALFNVFPEHLFVDTDDLSSIPYDVAGCGIRGTTYLTGRLILHPDDPDEKPFILVIDRCPSYDFVGWIHACDGKLPEFWPGPYASRPAFFVPRHANGFTEFEGEEMVTQ